MMDKNTEKIIIDTETLKRLLDGRARTGLSWASVIRYAKRIEAISKGAKLTAPRIYQR